jgi:hypothetical protein
VLAGATWEHYELELAMRSEKSVPRLAYLAKREYREALQRAT